MNKSSTFLISAMLFPALIVCGDSATQPSVSGAKVAVPQAVTRTAEQQYIWNKYHGEFLRSLVAGVITAPAVDGIKDNILPNIDVLNLHGKFGLCREQLTGQAKVVVGLWSISAYEKIIDGSNPSLTPGNIATRLAGILVGLQLGAYGKKLILRK